MAVYREKSPKIEAIRWTHENVTAAWALAGEFGGSMRADDQSLELITPHGVKRVYQGDWIIKDERGGLYSCNHALFMVTYEAVGE